MGRIKQGLDYFPLNTDFMYDRVVRRVMKHEGDSAFTVLIYTLSYIYSGEGYYVRADDNFYDELSDQLFGTDNDGVRRIIRLLADYHFFDSSLYERHSILTSADIQRQFLFIARRRSRRHILPDYCLLPQEETQQEGERAGVPDTASGITSDVVAATRHTVCKTPDIVAESPDAATNSASLKRKEKERKEYILPNPPFEGGDEGGKRGEFREKEECGEGIEPVEQKTAKKKRDLTQEDIDRMQVPGDGLPRNFSGLLENLRLYHVPPAEQYAIVLKSNYGEIGGNVWKGFNVIRGSGGKIKLPGHYLLSVLR